MKDDPNPNLLVDIAVRSKAWRRNVPGLERLVREAACAAAASPKLGVAELSIVLTDDAEIRGLNERWRGQDKPTNVLSFPAGAETLTPGAPAMLGDVVIAFETVAREAEGQKKPLADHLRHLIVHGVLHLLGHDHVVARDAERMERLETRILAGLGVPDPYVVNELGRG